LECWSFHFPENSFSKKWIGSCLFSNLTEKERKGNEIYIFEGEAALRTCEVICKRIQTYRDEHGSDRFIDVRYPDLVENPIETVKRIYQVGYTLPLFLRLKEPIIHV